MKGQSYRNGIDVRQRQAEGDAQREEVYGRILSSSQSLPRTVTEEDIDRAFKEWVDKGLDIVSENGALFPTMTMFSNQRFSEYSQTWQHTDENKNLLLNFKTVSRENNPKKGTMYGNLWNTPGQYYLIDKRKVLDDNGTESLLQTEMMMPTALDIRYKVSVFTTLYKKINEFNEKVNHLFDSIQVYIFPNEHPMQMTLENIADESSYKIDDRQFYAQSYDIVVKGYVITDEHYRITEKPLRECLDFSTIRTVRTEASVSIDETEGEGKTLTMDFPVGVTTVTFTIDDEFVVTGITADNVRGSCDVWVNDVSADCLIGLRMRDGDEVRVRMRKVRDYQKADVIFFGE